MRMFGFLTPRVVRNKLLSYDMYISKDIYQPRDIYIERSEIQLRDSPGMVPELPKHSYYIVRVLSYYAMSLDMCQIYNLFLSKASQHRVGTHTCTFTNTRLLIHSSYICSRYPTAS